MTTIEHSEEVEVPVRVAYDQWTQFESYPEFMEGVESVKRLSDTRTAWVAEIAGVRREFEADITEQHPDDRVAWRSTGKPHQAGVVMFHRLGDSATKVTLRMEYDPEGFVETAGDWLQLVRMRIVDDMKRFKAFVEARGRQTGGWRGDVPGPHEPGSTYGEPGPIPPGTAGGGDSAPPGGTLPPPGPMPPRDTPPEGPRPMP
ncbi:SRPBCC family protein [Nonomuraea sp. B12E4]|uniref:SRPBCC family protein n=1 Tax=Nonomuraea sp. B12E4 TaxID=3153564 RepID=UPI00325CE066